MVGSGYFSFSSSVTGTALTAAQYQSLALLFHSLLLHRSSPLISKKYAARLALITHVRNFKFQNYSYDINKSWRIYNFSEITKIEKKLGNHYLSPYRIIND